MSAMHASVLLVLLASLTFVLIIAIGVPQHERGGTQSGCVAIQQARDMRPALVIAVRNVGMYSLVVAVVVALQAHW
jgi:hypothetical protein